MWYWEEGGCTPTSSSLSLVQVMSGVWKGVKWEGGWGRVEGEDGDELGMGMGMGWNEVGL